MPEAGSDRTVEVVTMGEAMQLLVAEPGTALRRAATFRTSVAGAETNVAIGLARLGHSTTWLSRVGADAAGHAVLSMLRAEGVDVSGVETDPSGYTALLMRDSHPTRAIEVQYYRAGSAATRLGETYIREVFARDPAIAGARLVHVSGITAMLSPTAARATTALLDLAEQNGALISFDPNVRRKLGRAEQWRSAVEPILRRADLVFAGADELELVTGSGCDQAVDQLMSDQARSVLVKNDDLSCTLTTGAGRWRQPTLAKTVIDPVGAGDAVVSGYLSAWLRGTTEQQALLAGVVSAALVVGAVTDVEGLPDRCEHEQACAAATAAEAGVHR